VEEEEEDMEAEEAGDEPARKIRKKAVGGSVSMDPVKVRSPLLDALHTVSSP